MRIEGLRTLVWFWKPAICWRTQYILIDFRKRWSNPLYLIRKFLRLLGDLIKYNGVAHYCYGCLHRLKYEASLQTHIEYCKQHKAQRIYFPKKRGKFANIDRNAIATSYSVCYLCWFWSNSKTHWHCRSITDKLLQSKEDSTHPVRIRIHHDRSRWKAHKIFKIIQGWECCNFFLIQ